MVNTLSHLGIGLLIASAAGLNSRQIKIVAFMAILPDLDFILNVLLLAIDQNLSHHIYNSLYYFMGHREFMHSLVFAFLVLIYLWFREKDRALTIASAAAILSHIYLDYVTSWKMRPFFPLITDASTLGALDFFDPVVTVISLIPVYYILAGYVKKNRPGNGKCNWFCALAADDHKKLYTRLLIVLTVWCLLSPFSKALLISAVEKTENADIGYQNSYPVSPGKFLSAYRYNDSHYKILISSYWSGIEKTDFVRIYSSEPGNSMSFITRSKMLYDAGLPGEIDYPVYNASASESNVTVTISDARNSYAKYWAYFKTEYVFTFNNNSTDYTVHRSRHYQEYETLPVSQFE